MQQGRVVAIIAATCISATLGVAAHTQAPPAHAGLTRALEALVAPDEPGAALCVVQNGVVTALAARGLANLEPREPMTTTTPVYIASVAKGFTTVAILRMVEAKKLTLDDTLGRLMPSLPAYTAPVTIRQLLSHTSGMPDYDDNLRGDPEVTNATVLRWLAQQPGLTSAPGSEWSYNNAGFVVLAAVFERVSGRSLAEYVQTEFFAPLQMTSSFVFSPETRSRARAVGYSKKDGAWVRDDYNALTVGPGGIYSSAEDMCRWGIAFDAGKLLKPMTIIAAHTPQVTSVARPTPMGLGFQVEDIGRGPLQGQWYAALFGIRAGFRAVEMKVKDRPFRYVQLSNSGRQLEPMVVPNLIFANPPTR